MVKAVISSFVVVAFAIVFSLWTLWGANDTAVTHEEAIDAQVQANMAKYSEFSSTAVESMGVATQYKKAVAEVISAGIEGRFGKDGSKSLVQAFSEAYPATLDPTLFNRVQLVIESGRRDFTAEQRMLISKVQSYKLDLRKGWSGMWMSAAGYPTIDLKDPKYNVVVSGATKQSFETGVDEGIKF